MSQVSSQTKSKSNPKSNRICEFCYMTFRKPSKLEIHRRVHTGERPFSCNLCDYSTNQKPNLQAHIRRHLHEKPFKCPEVSCNYSSSVKGKITEHHKAVHLKDKRYGCPISGCGYKTGWHGRLTSHMKTHEENPEKPFKCKLCPYKAITKGHIKSHMTHVHSNERNFKCSHEGCTFAGKTQSTLNGHLDYHKEKTLVCPQPNCEYKTNHKVLLRAHVKIHGGDSAKKHKCKFCDYSSYDMRNFATHIRTHTKETPFNCKVDGCSFVAARERQIKTHQKSKHSKETDSTR